MGHFGSQVPDAAGRNWQTDPLPRIEAITPAAPATLHPRFLEGEGRCPPEDIGGFWGYADFLAAIADPAHERHDEFLDRCGGAFDPTDSGAAAIRHELGKLAKRLARRKNKPAATRTTN